MVVLQAPPKVSDSHVAQHHIDGASQALGLNSGQVSTGVHPMDLAQAELQAGPGNQEALAALRGTNGAYGAELRQVLYNGDQSAAGFRAPSPLADPFFEEWYTDGTLDVLTDDRQVEVAKGPAAKVVLQSEGSLPNEFRENELSGECAVMHNDQEILMDTFVADARELFSVWSEVREQSDRHFDATPLEARLQQFYSDWMNLPSNVDAIGNPVAFHGNQVAVTELSRRLDAGLIPVYLNEIRVFNPVLDSYARLLGVGEAGIVHNYDLLTYFSVSAGGGEGFVAEVERVEYTIHYSNSLGMTWTQTTSCNKGGAGVGVSSSPVSANVASGGGGSMLNAGSVSTRRYYPPDFFDFAAVTYAGGEALVGTGGSLGEITFHTPFDSLEFNTSGAIGKVGTDLVGSASVTAGGGVCLSSTTSDGAVLPTPEPVPSQLRPGQWVPLIEAGVFFDTGDATLDGDDMATLEQVVRAVVAHDLASPGDSFRVSVVGRSSNRWRGSTGEFAAEELNSALAGMRADAVEAALMVELGDIEADVTSGVFSESKLLSLVGAARGTDPDDNGQVDRSVQIAVLYNPCGTDGEVQP